MTLKWSVLSILLKGFIFTAFRNIIVVLIVIVTLPQSQKALQHIYKFDGPILRIHLVPSLLVKEISNSDQVTLVVNNTNSILRIQRYSTHASGEQATFVDCILSNERKTIGGSGRYFVITQFENWELDQCLSP